MDELDLLEEHLPYPVQHYLTSDIRKAAAEQGKPDMTSMWAGQAYSMSKSCRAEDFTKQLWEEALGVIRHLKV
jgi:nitronate monooxygenase